MWMIEIKPKVNYRRKGKRPADPLNTRYGHKTISGVGIVGRVLRKKKKGRP